MGNISSVSDFNDHEEGIKSINDTLNSHESIYLALLVFKNGGTKNPTYAILLDDKYIYYHNGKIYVDGLNVKNKLILVYNLALLPTQNMAKMALRSRTLVHVNKSYTSQFLERYESDFKYFTANLSKNLSEKEKELKFIEMFLRLLVELRLYVIIDENKSYFNNYEVNRFIKEYNTSDTGLPYIEIEGLKIEFKSHEDLHRWEEVNGYDLSSELKLLLIGFHVAYNYNHMDISICPYPSVNLEKNTSLVSDFSRY